MKYTRRNFLGTSAAMSAAKWSGVLGLLGFRFHAYAYPALVGWRGWLTWGNRLVGFVRINGSIRWW